MQNKIEITNEQLLVVPQGVNKLTSLKNKIEIPLQHVCGATIDEEILNESKGVRAPGTAIGDYWAGSFIKNGEKIFFNIKRGNLPVVIQLVNEKYTRLVLGVDNPKRTVDLINNKIN